MLCPDLRDVRVYLHGEPVDMHRQRNGLAALVRAVINQDPFGRGSENGDPALHPYRLNGGNQT